MPRIPEQQLERLKQEISLQRLVEARGIELKKHGADLIGHCPFHDDKTPSLVISPKSNLWHCLGACQTGGSVIDWVMKAEGVSFRHAVEILRTEDGGQTTEPLSSPVKRATVPKLPTPLASAGDDARLLTQVIDYYHQTLKQSPEALAYLDKRGVANAEAIDRFKLGYANRTLGYRLPAKNRQEGAAIRGQLQRLGLYRDSGHEHFSGSLIIPIIDSGAGQSGVISEVYGRKINDHLRKGTPKHLYLPGPHRGVWNAPVLSSSAEIILCESLLDALTFWCAGFRNVTASFGVEGFTPDHLKAFKTHGTERVLIAYDRDKAGDAAAVKLAERLNQDGIDAYRLQFPHGMDANEYALQVTPASKSLGVVIRRAVWLGQGKAKSVTTASPHPVVASAEDAQSLKPLAAQETTLVASVMDTEAMAVPSLPSSGVTVQHGQEGVRELFITLGDRVYRVRGLEQNRRLDQLNIQLRVQRDDTFHLDKLDLTSSKQRQVFINQAGVELGLKEDIVKKDLGQILLSLEQQQRPSPAEPGSPPPMDAPARQAALDLLHDPELLNRILSDVEQTGVVGERSNTLVAYLACVSRKLDKPLAVMIQSSSAAGKSALMESILALMPEDERVQYSAMTGQSLFYMGEADLKHKILAISEEEGASNASYALKLLQSEGEVTIASTGKDEASGNLITKDYKVEGPVMLFMTTTAIDIDEELLNRCVVLSVNESRAQTQAIHQAQRQRRTLQGLYQQLEKDRITTLHRNAQRLLQPLAVINPYADQLTFLDDKTRTRRDHEKYLTLIDSIALLHQYQRPVQTIQHHGQGIDYVEVTLNDIDVANRLAREVLGKTLDELPPQTRKLLNLITELVTHECQQHRIEPKDFRFSRRQVRHCCGWSETQVRVHMQRLVSLEYLLTHRGGRGQSFEYELLYSGEGQQGEAFLMGLLEVAKLKKPAPSGTDANGGAPHTAADNTPMTVTSRGESPSLAGPSRPQRGPLAEAQNTTKPLNHKAYQPTSRTANDKAYPVV